MTGISSYERFTTESQVRAAFWRFSTGNKKPYAYRGYLQNELPASIRTAWIDFVDALQKSKKISEKLASRVTL